jgi:hypothetical protein
MLVGVLVLVPLIHTQALPTQFLITPNFTSHRRRVRLHRPRHPRASTQGRRRTRPQSGPVCPTAPIKIPQGVALVVEPPEPPANRRSRAGRAKRPGRSSAGLVKEAASIPGGAFMGHGHAAATAATLSTRHPTPHHRSASARELLMPRRSTNHGRLIRRLRSLRTSRERWYSKPSLAKMAPSRT